MRKYLLLIIAIVCCAALPLIFLLLPTIFSLSSRRNLAASPNAPTSSRIQSQRQFTQDFLADGFRTNTAKHSIPLDQILNGGPGKDGIPALAHPSFVFADQAKKFFSDASQGIIVTSGTTTRFYPFAILNWHEVVDDTIEGRPLLITYCPLCGSAIVYDRRLDGKERVFGVSGKLYESNLLMYDHETESLWSQVPGEAVVGDETGKKLTLYPSDVLTFGEARKRFPRLEILSRDTGYARDYQIDPYGDYASRPDIFFPVSVQDRRLPAKEIMYIVNVGDQSIAFRLKDLRETRKAQIQADSTTIIAEITDQGLRAHEAGKTEIIPGYYAMWFSWAVFHQKDGILWQKP